MLIDIIINKFDVNLIQFMVHECEELLKALFFLFILK